ncbi:MAG: LLM class flavin-dependent oxidoreductase [Pseudomonadota bacterium]
MKLGAAIQPLSTNPAIGELTEFAKQLEALGYESLWVTQAVGRGFMLPDPLLILAAAAGATSRPSLGTAILQIPLYPPAYLAHLLLSLKHLAGKRMRIGVGPGSTAADFQVFEKEYETRFKCFSDNMDMVKQLISGQASGDVNLTPYENLRDEVTFYLGTWGKGIRRAANDFDGWIASAANRDLDQLTNSLRQYRDEGGQHAIVSTIALTIDQSAEQHREKLEQFSEAGFDEAVVMFRPGGPSPEEVRRWL